MAHNGSGIMSDADRYALLARDVCERAPDLPVIACGFSACIDRLSDLESVLDALKDTGDGKALALHDFLLGIAQSRHGGEFRFDWDGGDSFFSQMPCRQVQPGGTAVQAANQMAAIGATPLLALQRRDPALLGLLHADVVLAPPVGPDTGAAADLKTPVHPVIEFNSAHLAGAKQRADRIILRFGEEPFEQDEAFAAYASAAENAVGAAIISGFNALEDAAVEPMLNCTITLG